jgi:hypothetical protein
METVWDLVVVVHLVGMAAVVGGWLTQVGSARPQVPVAVLYGAIAQVISGPVLVGLASSGAVDHDIDNAKIGVKLVVALAVFVVAYLGRRRDDEELAPAPAAAEPAVPEPAVPEPAAAEPAVAAPGLAGRAATGHTLAGPAVAERAVPTPAAPGAAGTVAAPGPAAGPATARVVDWRAPVNLAGALALVNVLIAVLWH